MRPHKGTYPYPAVYDVTEQNIRTGGTRMTLPDKSFYSFFQVASRWDVPLDELLQWGATKKMVFSIIFSGPAVPLDRTAISANLNGTPFRSKSAKLFTGLFPLPPESSLNIIRTGETASVFYSEDGRLVAAARLVTLEGEAIEFALMDDYTITADTLFVTADEVDRMEKNYPDLVVMAKESTRIDAELQELFPEDSSPFPSPSHVSPLDDEPLHPPSTGPMPKEKLLEVGTVAKKLNIEASTVRRMFHRGILRGLKTGPTCTRIRIFESSVKAHLEQTPAFE